MRVLITGASGFIGQHLTRALADDYEVHALYEGADSTAKNAGVRHEAHFCSLTDHAGISALVASVRPHVVIHLAAKTEVALSFDNYLEVSDVNYIGTVGLAEANLRLNPDLTRFVMASTMETYGHQDPSDGPFDEDTPQRPMAPYAVAKLACEKYLLYLGASHDFPYTILRQTNAYGRADNDFFVVERMVSQMVAGQTCMMGEPDPMRNFLFIDDLVDLYLAVLSSPWSNQEVFVTGPDNALSIRDLADVVIKKLAWDGDLRWHTQPLRPGEIFYLNSQAAKAAHLLGWEPRVGLSEGLDRTIEIWRRNLRAAA